MAPILDRGLFRISPSPFRMYDGEPKKIVCWRHNREACLHNLVERAQPSPAQPSLAQGRRAKLRPLPYPTLPYPAPLSPPNGSSGSNYHSHVYNWRVACHSGSSY